MSACAWIVLAAIALHVSVVLRAAVVVAVMVMVAMTCACLVCSLVGISSGDL